LISFVAISLIAVLALGFVISNLFPAATARALHAGLRLSAGLEAKVVDTDFGAVGYLEGGQGDTIVFVHGIYGRKEHWVDLSRVVSDGYRVLLLDLPGFGANRILGNGAYDYERQKENLVTVIDSLGVGQFHFAANSMGAQIAAMIAIEQPDRVLSIAFIGSPVQITSPEPSDMQIALAQGDKPLVVQTRDDFTRRMGWLFPKQPFIPAAIVKTWATEEAANGPDNLRIWDEVENSKTRPLQDIAPELSQPALIVWCREDRIFDYSGAAGCAERRAAGYPEGLRACSDAG